MHIPGRRTVPRIIPGMAHNAPKRNVIVLYWYVLVGLLVLGFVPEYLASILP